MSSDVKYASDTLRILHLPSHLSDERCNELFQKYGAIKTKTLRPSSKYIITFAKFPSHQIAIEALQRLHQLNVRGQYLSVEFARKSTSLEFSENEKHHEKSTINEEKKETSNKSHFQAFLKKLNSWTLNQMFTQPPPPNIKYRYAAPTRTTLIRIAIQLVKEPMFYTQVLHLMNRMNLPPPFEELDSEFPMLKEIYNIEKYRNIFGIDIEQEEAEREAHEEEEEEEESEIESDGEINTRPLDVIPIKRKRPQSTKRLKIPKFVNPAKQMVAPTSTQKSVKTEDMFESVQLGETKNLKIELKTVEKLLDAANQVPDDTVTKEGGFGLMYPSSKTGEDATLETENEAKANESEQEFVTSEQLAANRISVNDQRVLPVFKNYHSGKPSNRLYIKNLAKQVEISDLHFIYRKYVVPGLKSAENEYDVRLMQEGRMKGQAFITLQNLSQAQLALEETNGYILKNKPMVVQFAKVAKT